MNIDCVVLANTKNIEMYGMTQRAIHTLLWSELSTNFNIVVMESNRDALSQGFIYDLLQPRITTVYPDEEFGYNRFLNIGINTLKNLGGSLSDWVIISNNDVVFTQHWLTNMLKWQADHPDVLSMSPWEPNWHIHQGLDPNQESYIGYRTSKELTGWCLVIHKSVFDICNLFDPQFDFWYQDDDYGLTLQQKQIKHALVTKSRVYHMMRQSHNTITSEQLYEMTHKQHEKLKKKWNIT